MAVQIEWMTPPERKVAAGRPINPEHIEIAALLQSRPGEWALIGRGVSTGLAQTIRNGSRAFRKGQYEAVSRNSIGNRGDIYARYVGQTIRVAS